MQTDLVQPGDADALVGFLTGEPWPFHAGVRPGAADVRARIAAGAFTGPDVETYWLSRPAAPRAGLLRLFDLGDDTAEFDLRVRAAHRGSGLGTEAVGWLVGQVFDHHACTRVEAMTRVDNVAMRRVLVRCGWVKEAHHRRAWPTADGSAVDAVAYAVLRQDRADGTTTPVHWDDEPR
ncbi:GNAT family N-acetyltransferase [Modestobacter sp. I12A-02628]|uniref:GNAT N-acetyltransferase n=1 Tax=Goekera deserti TaxID=2497753 RepID=A0A7K3WEC6_9ACTN|nr:GNAT family N-acetyltransferase [Goekera deserti]MPQ99706.1 GNAT family N-acetyltransferase [Goekera deserti]NDI46284.1 GNAT family N-acetyltransferase [Goekera deserti]NEL54784.1 GNAT N-acetyltransferase [Goekera deserti]